MNTNTFKKFTLKKRKANPNKVKHGGRVIASGGYGCIFRPALKCINKSRPKNEVSKLMTNKHIQEEYDDIVRFKPFLEKIPNYNYYFFINGVYTCKPDKLTDDDLKDYEKKCKALKKDGFSVKNINDSLNEISLLNMPDGGLDVGDYIETITKGSQFITLNNSLIDLLLNGIIPMNKYDIYHCDIKESNILVNTKEGFHTKLIDWGLSAKYNGTEIPESMFERPFQYNLPYSIILFNETFKKMYQKLLDSNPNPNYYAVRAFVIDYIFLWNEKRGPGHIKYMIGLMESFFDNNLINIDKENRKEIIEMEFLYYYIIEYLTKILMKFTKGDELMLMDYFNNVFLKNIDVWGLVMTYYPIINILHENYSELDKLELKLFNKLKYIFIHYLFENSTEPISVNNLVEDLRELNTLFKQAEKNTKDKSIITLVTSLKNTKSKTKSSKKTSQKNKKQPRTMLFIEAKK
jgi:serine/threonine protein kinase